MVSWALRSSSSSAIASWSRSQIVGTVPERVAGGGFIARWRELDRALPLAALEFVGAGPVPIDELLHGLQGEIGWQRQIFHDRFESLGAAALDEGVELLAVLALGLVETDPALDRLGDALGRQPRFEPLAEDHLAALEVAADV